MPATRRSARVAALQSDSSAQETSSPAGTKRKTDATGSSPIAKRGKKNAHKEQMTIEETMDVDDPEQPKPEAKENGDVAATDAGATKVLEDAPMEDTIASDAATEWKNGTTEPKPTDAAADKESGNSTIQTPEAPAQQNQEQLAQQPQPLKETVVEQSAEKKTGETISQNADEVSAPAAAEPKPDAPAQPTISQPTAQEPIEPSFSLAERPEKRPETTETTATAEPFADASKINGTGRFESTEAKQDSVPETNGNAVEPKAREEDVPSSILEKGIIYFFFRARVNVENPQDINDLARSYMVIRPIPHGAKLTDGPIGDEGNCRLLALPKKVLPKSGKDRFMVFVEKAKTSFSELKDSFLSASDYTTKTSGMSHTPAATPVAEGVYAITTTGRESHLAYMITIPNELGEVQKDIGLRETGSFIVSAKNPKYPGPANTNIGGDPGYSQQIMEEFRDLRWMPLQPKLLDYVNTQFLIIGESIEHATEPLPRDEKKDKDTPMEEMEKLEGEDEIRVRHLKGDDAVFADLGVSKNDYPSVPTTW